jgi:hypothetical protein
MRIEPATAWPWAFRPPADDVPAGAKARIPEGKWRIAAGSQQDGVIRSALSVTSTRSGERCFGPPRRGQHPDWSIPASFTEILAEHIVSSAVQSSGPAFPGPKGTALRRSNSRRGGGRRVPPLTLRASSSTSSAYSRGARDRPGRAAFQAGGAASIPVARSPGQSVFWHWLPIAGLLLEQKGRQDPVVARRCGTHLSRLLLACTA